MLICKFCLRVKMSGNKVYIFWKTSKNYTGFWKELAVENSLPFATRSSSHNHSRNVFISGCTDCRLPWGPWCRWHVTSTQRVFPSPFFCVVLVKVSVRISWRSVKSSVILSLPLSIPGRHETRNGAIEKEVDVTLRFYPSASTDLLIHFKSLSQHFFFSMKIYYENCFYKDFFFFFVSCYWVRSAVLRNRSWNIFFLDLNAFL